MVSGIFETVWNKMKQFLLSSVFHFLFMIVLLKYTTNHYVIYTVEFLISIIWIVVHNIWPKQSLETLLMFIAFSFFHLYFGSNSFTGCIFSITNARVLVQPNRSFETFHWVHKFFSSAIPLMSFLQLVMVEIFLPNGIVGSIEQKEKNLITFIVMFYFFFEGLKYVLLSVRKHREGQEKIKLSVSELEKESASQFSFIKRFLHSVRNAQNGIFGFGCLLLKEISPLKEVPTKDKRYLKTLLENTITISKDFVKRIEDVYIFSKDKVKYEPKRIAFMKKCKNFLNNLVRIYSTSISQNVTLKIEFDENIPRYATTDFRLLMRVFENLFTNSVKYTEKGKINIKLTYERTSRKFNIIFKDSGIGISQNKLQKILQGEDYTDEDISLVTYTSGLGMKVVRECERLLPMGKLTLSSEGPMKGTRASFECSLEITLPLKSDKKLKRHRLHETRLIDTSQKFLIIDDKMTNTTITRTFLTELGFSPENLMISHRVKDALDILEKGNFCPDFILVDLLMEELYVFFFDSDLILFNRNGIEIVKIIRKLDKFENIKIFAITGSVFLEDEKKFCEKHKFNGVVIKPFTKLNLSKILTDYHTNKKKVVVKSLKSNNIKEDEEKMRSTVFSIFADVNNIMEILLVVVGRVFYSITFYMTIHLSVSFIFWIYQYFCPSKKTPFVHAMRQYAILFIWHFLEGSSRKLHVFITNYSCILESYTLFHEERSMFLWIAFNIITNFVFFFVPGKSFVSNLPIKDYNMFVLHGVFAYSIMTAKAFNGKIVKERKTWQDHYKTMENIKKDRESFIERITHEFSGICTGLDSMIDVITSIIEHSLAKKKLEEYFKMFIRSSNEMRHFLMFSVDYSRYKRGKFFLVEKSEVYLEQLIMDIIEYEKQFGTVENLIVKSKIEINPKIVVKCDLKRLRHLITNLISNAVKYSDEKVDIFAQLRINGEFLISVSHTGKPMAQKTIDEISSFRTDFSYETLNTLGDLYVNDKFANLMNGRMNISVEEHLTIIEVNLSFKELRLEKVKKVSSELTKKETVEIHEKSKSQKLRGLFVEDDFLCKMVFIRLTEEVFSVLESFVSPEQMIEAIENGRIDLNNFDIVVSDFNFANAMCGFDVARYVLERKKEIKVVLLTGDSELVRNGPQIQQRHGITKVVGKPIERVEILKVLNEIKKKS